MNDQQQALYLELKRQEIQAELEQATAKRDATANPRAVVMFDNMVDYLTRQLAAVQAQIVELDTVVETTADADEALIDAVVEQAKAGMVVIVGLKARMIKRILTRHFGQPVKGARSTGPSVRTTYHALRLDDGGQLRVTYTPTGATALVY